MRNKNMKRRLVSIVVAVAMITPALSSIAEAVVGNWLSPQIGEKIANRNVEVSVGYNTESDTKVTSLELWIDGSFYSKKTLVTPDSRGVCSFNWDTTRSPQGSHDLDVKIFAGDTLISTISGSVTVGKVGFDLRPPTVRFSNVKSGDILKGNAKIAVTASDDSGEKPIVSILVDKDLKLLSNRPPYICEVKTTDYQDGNHELSSYAYDGAGNKSDPAVVKVAFKNNIKRPVVAVMTVNPQPTGIARSEDDDIGKMLPPVEAPQKSTANTAARVSEARSDVPKQARIAAPIASTSEPDMKAMNPEPAVKAISPVHSSTVVQKPVQPSEKTSLAKVEVTSKSISNKIAEHKSLATPKSSETKYVSIASSASVRPEHSGATAMPSGSVEPSVVGRSVVSVIGKPIASTPKSVAISKTDAKLRSYRMARIIPSELQSPRLQTEKAASATPPKPVRTAMLPSIRGGYNGAVPMPTVTSVPPVQRETMARKEKKIIPASGKVKLRDLVQNLGGVLFWDSETRTVRACLPGLELVMHIGSDTVNVNGKDISVGSSPLLVDGRTIIDASVIQQAFAAAKSSTKSASR